MKAIMLTIRLKWFYLTYKGIKTIEVRKSAPKDFVGDVYEVVSKTNFEKDLMEIPENEREFFKQFKGKVGLKFTLNKVEEIYFENHKSIYCDDPLYPETDSLSYDELLDKSCTKALPYGETEIGNYIGEKGYAWHISNLVIFDRPRELGEFKHNEEHKSCLECPYYNVCETTDYIEVRKGICYIPVPLTKAPQSYMFIEVKE
jgi:hypothetical protein